MKLGCVIMAAGKGQRFGSNKLLAPLQGKPLMHYCLQALPRPRLARCLAVVSSTHTAGLCQNENVPYLLYEGGPQSQSVRLGIQAMEDMDGCLFVLADQPLCTAQSVGAVLDEFERHPQSICRLAFGQTLGSPVIFPRRLFGALARLTGDKGGMAAAGGEPVRLVYAQFEQELWDADTPQALGRISAFLCQNARK